jgi:hypothetical protein
MLVKELSQAPRQQCIRGILNSVFVLCGALSKNCTSESAIGTQRHNAPQDCGAEEPALHTHECLGRELGLALRKCEHGGEPLLDHLPRNRASA